MFIITLKTHNIFINPILACMGYNLYDVRYERDGKEYEDFFLIKTKGERLINGERCRIVELSEQLYLGWYNKLIAKKYDGSCNRGKVGRPQLSIEIINLVIKFKKENPRWGYQKITDQIKYLGFKISKTSVKNILIENGYDPEPDLTIRSGWHEFLNSHWDVMAACDFFTIELLVQGHLIRCTVFFVIEFSSRKVFYAPIKLQPDGNYMRQVARILTDCEDGFLKGKRYLIHDRDPLYRSEGFYDILQSSGIEPIKLPARSPNLNEYYSNCTSLVA